MICERCGHEKTWGYAGPVCLNSYCQPTINYTGGTAERETKRTLQKTLANTSRQLETERARVRVLRGQLINCVDHLSGARRKSPHVMEHILPVIEQANRVIATTAPEAGDSHHE